MGEVSELKLKISKTLRALLAAASHFAISTELGVGVGVQLPPSIIPFARS
jgi:hypothetical protein